ncbi:glycosyltransferase family 2 protein [Liquorilactobacillus nagelii]|uniref:glycosyltransferase family 2 protein n=1 Tax=Liquorilactobacillus nagelii TaxID=82688 RepID=UPI0039E7EDB5
MLTIGITTHDRIEDLKRMARSLYKSNLSIPYNISIYDDASTEFDSIFLKKIFKNANVIHRNSKIVGADRNSYLMYQNFLQSDDEFFFNADSDLIFRKDWLEKGMNLLKETDGILTLFNSSMLSGINTLGNVIEKKRVGAAGVLMTRKIVETIMSNFDYYSINGKVPQFDMKWCDILNENNIKIYSVCKSLVQHIGLAGQNSNFNFFEYGIGFEVDSKYQGQIFNDLLLNISTSRFKPNYSVFPFDEIPKNSNVIIYGYGIAGINYVKQVQATKYCNIKCIVDKNWNLLRDDVKSPRLINEVSFDYIVIATVLKETALSIKKNIMSINGSIKEKQIIIGNVI